MKLLSELSRAELLAALELQYEWGVDEALQEDVVNCLEDVSRRLPQRPPVMPRSELSNVSSKSTAISSVEQAKDWPSLMQASQALNEMFLARTAMHRLMPVMVENAPFLLLGETPDADEDRSGVLFSGKAGKLLDDMLRSIGLERSSISMAPAVPWRPPGGRGITNQEMAACRPLLLKIVELSRASVVVTMGITPLRMLLGESVILSRVRGKWQNVSLSDAGNAVRVLPMRHPLQLSATSNARRMAWHDLLVLAENLSVDK